MKENQYIRCRKFKAMCNSFCFRICRIFPIKKNLISVCTFEGKGGFGCNPKYIVQELHRRNSEYKFVWFVNDMDKDMPEYVKKVPNNVWSRAYWLSRSKVWIDNYRKPYGTIKRRGQYYVNTWHGSIFIKPIGLWRGKAFSKMAYLVSKNDSDMIDDLLIDTKWCEIAGRKGFVYNGNFSISGMPRCDILYGDKSEAKAKLRERFGLEPNSKIVMYAPTFRETAKNGKRFVHSELSTIDFDKLIKSLEDKFGGLWYICLRVHPQLAKDFTMEEKMIKNRIFDVSKCDDMYELLAGVDVYISDYSSTAFEAAFADIPVFIYADDLEQYSNNRGGLMWNLFSDDKKTIVEGNDSRYPFAVSRDNNELVKSISSFDMEDYINSIGSFKQEMGLVFDGKASCRVADNIENRLG